MNHYIKGKTVAILVANGFEQAELVEPRKALVQAGAATHIISPEGGKVRAWNENDFGDSYPVDIKLSAANPDNYAALLLPGGVLSPDTLRTIPEAVAFVHNFFDAGKPVAAICHGPQLLIEADVVRGRTLTSFPSLKADLINAGAIWVDEAVVTDHGLVTSRHPADIPQFTAKIIETFSEEYYAVQQESAASSKRLFQAKNLAR